MDGLSNLDSFEGSVSGTATVTFTRRPRRVTITNNSITNELQFKFKSSETFATLMPTETISLEVTIKQVLLSGTADYRIWGLG